ncbi:hypothetical protein Taro_026734 [Colocasia esculenta]|uniref:Uncharacterized protein n=1 Tax=Colocasia esculenta TaxID=4460 RepID=A0A843VS64_COLES|nr:hypothetical protein [Colocasia esculenta]
MQERIISGRKRDEDIEDEVEMYAEYVSNPDVQERRARAQSRAEAWEADQRAGYRMKSFREAIRGFAEPSAIAGRERVEGELMVAWIARATTEWGEYELDEEADDPKDPPRPNTFLARAVVEATAEEEGDRGNVGQPYSPRYEMDLEAEVNILGDIELEHVEHTIEDDTPSPLDSPRLPNSASHDLMLEVTVVVTVEVEVEVVTVVRKEEMVTVVREEEVVGWHSQRSNFFGVQPKILVIVPHCSITEGRSLDLAVMQEVQHYHPESTSTDYCSGYTATASYLDGTTESSPSRLPDVGPLSQAISTEIPYHDDMG